MEEETIINNLKVFTALPRNRGNDVDADTFHPGAGVGSLAVQAELHACADALIDAVLRDSPIRRKKRIIESHLIRIERDALNRREQTRVAKSFLRMSGLLKINSSFAINRWLHGWAVALLGMLLGARGI